MKVKLISYSKPSEDLSNEGLESLQDLVSFCARVSNPSNQMNTETSEKLIKYLIKNKHWSPFEMVNVCLEIETTRDIARQILRHRSFSFQEFCLSGDTDIYFAKPCKYNKGYYRPKITYKLSDLYDKWTNGAKPIPSRYNPNNDIRIPLKDRIKNMLIKCYDEDEKKLTVSHIKDIFYTGKKELYKVTLSDGKVIKSTKEHKFLSKDGFLPLEDIIGLELVGKDKKAAMTKEGIVAVNGVLNYRDREWLLEKKNESLFKGGGLKYISEKYELNLNTIRKWLKKLDICYTPEEKRMITGEIWNKGKFGYKNKPHSEETRQKMRESARKGPDSNLWRGGGSKNDVRKTFDNVKALTYKREKNFQCERCQSNDRLNIHHKIPVSEDSSKINDIDNWELLCSKCHIEHHQKEGYTGWQSMQKKYEQKNEKRRQNSYIPKWVKITNVEYLGLDDTYDLEIDHKSHNYVANGIIVHNSQRYANPVEELKFELREARLQDTKNRQNSIETDDEKLQEEWDQMQQNVIEEAKKAYNWAIKNNIAREQARAVLPEGNTISRLYINGTLRSWIHYLEVRSLENGTQREHAEVAKACAEVISNLFPVINSL